jgi:hypothetical protein
VIKGQHVHSHHGQGALRLRIDCHGCSFGNRKGGPGSVSPSQVGDHRAVIRWEDTVDRLTAKCDSFYDHLLVFVARTEEDVIDSLVDQLRSRLKGRRWMS